MKIEYSQPGGKNSAAVWIRCLVLSWLMAAALEYLLLPAGLRTLTGLSGLAQMSLGRLILLTVVFSAVNIALSHVLPGCFQRWTVFAVGGLLCFCALKASFTWPFFTGCVLILAVLLGYALMGWNGRGLRRGFRFPESRKYPVLAALLAAVFFAIVGFWTTARVYSFSVPTFDFGIFAQMFHSMKTTGLPVTTLERTGPLSHFAVHVSPIYYLMLPFYMLVPAPATLQVLQAAVLASAVIPLWKLGKHHNLKPWLRLMLCGILLCYPAYAGGTSYDIHENCFLTPLILWLLYGLDRRCIAVTAVSALLTLMVKEDAAVYVAVIGLYLLLRGLVGGKKKWEMVTGAALLVGALAWFFAVTSYLAEHGDGVMTYRYKNFMYDVSGSLVTVIKAVLLCPMKAVFECVDPEKLKFIGLTMLPLAGLPLLTRRYERYLLLIPYILVNLMSDYQYQHDIFFQYTFGSTGCLMYLTLVNLADLKLNWQRIGTGALALIIGLGCFWVQILPKATRYPKYLKTYAAYYDGLREVLDVIPEDAAVAATTYYTTYLSQRDAIYDVRYASTEHLLSCEYIAVGVTDSGLKKFKAGQLEGLEGLMTLLEMEGYEKIAEYPGKLEIYQRK